MRRQSAGEGVLEGTEAREGRNEGAALEDTLLPDDNSPCGESADHCHLARQVSV